MVGVSEGIRQFKTSDDYRQKEILKKVKPSSLKDSKLVENQKVESLEKPSIKKSDSVEISKEAKDKIKSSALNTAGDLAKNIADKDLSPLIATAKATKNEAVVSDKVIKKVSNGEVNAPKIIRRPGVIFINGFSLFGTSDDDGLKQMAKYIPGSENYSYRQGGEILDSILKRPPNQPILLIGHGLGGDTAVEIANKLNSMKYGFREIKLLVTLDSVGFNNDIIPQNVRCNLNYIGDQGGIFNDGPNIAKKPEYTDVINELRSEGHGEIVDSKEVQYKVFEGINEVLQDSVIQNNMSRNSINNLENLRDSISAN